MAQVPNAADFGRLLAGMLAHPNSFGRVLDPGVLRGLLFPNAFHGTRFVIDDFDGDTLNTFLWTVDGDTGTTSFAIPAAGSTVAGSIISGATAADDNEAISIYGHPTWSGDKNCGMAVRFKFDDVADIFFETGFTDPLSDYTLPAINDIDTPTITNGAVTVAVIVMDTDQTLKTAALVCDGDSTYATSKVNFGTWAPTADTWYTAIVQTKGDTVMAWIYDTDTPASPKLVSGGEQVKVSGFEGGTLVQPWFIAGNRTTDGGLPVLDYIAVWADR